ncbi:MAG: ShlB/FhaC/HecB family hemolysin secretion/activation protein [Sphingobium sp.]
MLTATGTPVFAQAPAGSVPTREEITRPVEPAAPRPPRVRIDGDIERAPCALADPRYADIRVTINRATFSRLIGIDAADLEPLYRDYLGTDRPVSDICEIRDAVATALRRRGYLAAVQVPTQEIKGGEVRFEILYARLTAIRVRGDAGNSEAIVTRYLDKLTQDEVFNMREAERYLLLARDLPGIDIHLALKPTGTAGEVYGDVTVTNVPVEAELNVQNLNAETTGRWGAQGRVQINGLTGMGDRTTLAFYSTAPFHEQHVLQLGHEMRLGGEGLQIGGRFTYAWSQPDLPAQPDLVHARTLFATLEARYPLERTQASTIWLSGGMDFVNQTVRFDQTPIAHDKLRIAYLRIDGDLLDQVGTGADWHAAYWAELRQGLDILDATPGLVAGTTPPSRADGEGDSTLFRGGLSGELVVAPNVSIAANVSGQLSADRLFAFEEFSAGNYTIGRGYDPGTLIGDDGLGGSLEIRLDRLTPIRAPLVLQPFVFIDAARVWNRGTGGETLLSVGGGVRASYAERFRLDLTLAVPTRRVGLQTEREDPRLLVSFTTRLWPWPSGGE